MSKKRMKAVRAWAGVVDGEIDTRECKSFDGYGDQVCNRPALFMNRKDARLEYQEVRRVQITEVTP